jgi:hypothetical protein
MGTEKECRRWMPFDWFWIKPVQTTALAWIPFILDIGKTFFMRILRM